MWLIYYNIPSCIWNPIDGPLSDPCTYTTGNGKWCSLASVVSPAWILNY